MQMNVCEIFQSGWSNSQIIQRTQKCLRPHTFLNPVRRFYQTQGSTVFLFASRETEVAEVWLRTKMTRSRADDATAKPHFEQKSSAICNSRSQSPQRGRWIKKQSQLRCCGSRSCHAMYSILSLQKQNFSGNWKKLTKVCWTVTKAKSQWYKQFIRIWQNQWRFTMESSNINTSSIRKKWVCRTSCMTCERRNISSTTAIWIGRKVVGWFHGMLLKTLYERRFGESF